MPNLITKVLKKTYDNSYLELFFDNLRTKSGRVNLYHFLLGNVLELLWKYKLTNWIIRRFHSDRLKRYIKRKYASFISLNRCGEAGHCKVCSCKVPHMFWVKNCDGPCQPGWELIQKYKKERRERNRDKAIAA